MRSKKEKDELLCIAAVKKGHFVPFGATGARNNKNCRFDR
jgi:hypothetical protein